MDYQIVVVPEDALAAEHGWAMIETGDATIFAVKESALTPLSMADGWAAYRLIDRANTPGRQQPAPHAPDRARLQLLRGA